jgi:hypothetical protein
MFTWLAVSISYAAAFGFIGLSALEVVLIIGFKVKETVGPRRARQTEVAQPQPELATSASAASGDRVSS